MERRQVLRVLGATAATSTAGCRSLSDRTCPARAEPEWSIIGEYWSPPVRRDGRLLVSENYGVTGTNQLSRIVCIDTYDGQEQWVYNVERAGGGVPFVRDGRVYVGTGTDHVYAFDFETGHREWRYDAGGREAYGGGAWGQPTTIDDSVIVGISHSNRSDPDPADSGAYRHRVVALDRSDGSEHWTRSVDGMVWAGPVRAGDSIFVATRGGRLSRLHGTTGDRLWSVALDTPISSQPVVDADFVAVVTDNGSITAFDVESGEHDWQSQFTGNTESVGETDELVLVGDDTGSVTALSKDSGANRWQYDAHETIAGIEATSDVVWILTQRGFLHRVDPATGVASHHLRIAATTFEDACGWQPRYQRGTGITGDQETVCVTGPWIRAFEVPATE
mgnify:CR=1 FL=1